VADSYRVYRCTWSGGFDLSCTLSLVGSRRWPRLGCSEGERDEILRG
jgi:hypothetical protein